MLRLPIGFFYAQSVKSNVPFFDHKPGSDKPWAKKVWVYDLSANLRSALRSGDILGTSKRARPGAEK